ncbi:MAG: PSD1 and planctomycete cytochrome C domain-containing protein [Planctomycetota bacterium]
MLLVSLPLSLLLGTAVSGAAEPTFNRDIRPILSDACFQCHGPDANQRQAGLRLDKREQALEPAESGARAIVPGKLEASEIIRRITSTDPDVRMPPPDSGKQITAAQTELLRRWVAAGAAYEGHWAFQNPVRPSLPGVSSATAVRNPVDRFVVARLEQSNFALAAEASPATLWRRAALDLVGSPPTPEDLEDLLSANVDHELPPDAYERWLDRLLASPKYGERMALSWLDFARYADSNGFQVDSSRQMWPWRDWVIAAFNRNLPFDQFTVEQLAGDLLPDASRSQQVATGFHRNHRLNGEGGIIAEEWRVETVIDRVETTGLTWLGLTLNCFRCHDHKYDPISQREFYQFFAFFNNVAESGTLGGESRNTDPVVAVPAGDYEQQMVQLASERKAAEARLQQERQRLPELIAAWEPGFRQRFSAETQTWVGLDPTAVKSTGGATLARQSDGSYLAGGVNPANDVYEITAAQAAGALTGVLLEVFPDASLPNESLGRFPNGNFVLSKVELEVTAPDLKEPLRGKFNRAEADYSQANWDIKNVVAGNPTKGWAVDGNDVSKRLPRRAMFLLEHPLTIPENATIKIRLLHEALGQHNMGRFRLSTTAVGAGLVTLKGSQIPAALRSALEVPANQRQPEQRAEIEKFFLANENSPIRQAEAAIAAVNARQTELEKNLPTVMVMKELPKPRDAFLLVRGQYDRRGDKVEMGLPAALPGLPPGAPLNRLGLAQWIVAPSNPLTARVWVNRLWEKLFGVGIVKTSENFGSQAEYPSHPDLLDWLACEFRESRSGDGPEAIGAWDVKRLHRLVMTSATYRKSTQWTADSAQRDPENRLLSRGPRFRLPAEIIRDQALIASGLLNSRVGGPSARPYMPKGVWDETSRYGDLRNYQHELPGLYRRSLYTVWKRTAAPPTMLLFDAPNREICTVKRSRTNTPLQALSLLNEITFVEAARKLGERVMNSPAGTVEERLRLAVVLVLGRYPTGEELAVLAEGWKQDVSRFQARPEEAKQIISYGDARADANLNVAELAAYTLAANVLFNLDEFVSRE